MDLSEILVLDKLTYAGNFDNFTNEEKSRFEFVQGDICDSAIVDQLVKRVDLVVNFAAESHVDRSISSGTNFVQTNTFGTQVLLDSCRKHEISKYMQVSTDEVYGSIDEGSWNEEFPLLPNSPYSASKAGADLLVRAYGRTFDFHTNITRCSNNYGPYQYPEKVIPFFITRLIEGKKLPIYGNGKNVRDWLHVDDHCRGILSVLQNGSPQQIYNIGGGTELTNMQLSRVILDAFDKNESEIELVPDRLGHDFRYAVDYSKISKETGYKSLVPWDSGITETINWYKESENWWRPLLL
jgi:dTDP-glucose 4,6-dehydratase